MFAKLKLLFYIWSLKPQTGECIAKYFVKPILTHESFEGVFDKQDIFETAHGQKCCVKLKIKENYELYQSDSQ